MTTSDTRRMTSDGRGTAERALGRAVETLDSTGRDLASTVADIGEVAVSGLRTGVEAASARLPGLVEAGAAGSADAFQSLRELPDDRLMLVATFSVGLGVGLWLAGAPRLVTLAAFSPAIVMGLASVNRSGGHRHRRHGHDDGCGPADDVEPPTVGAFAHDLPIVREEHDQDEDGRRQKAIDDGTEDEGRDRIDAEEVDAHPDDRRGDDRPVEERRPSEVARES